MAFVHPFWARFVDVCKLNPAAASGHASVRLPLVVHALKGGLAWSRSWLGPIACVAAISAGYNAPL